VWRVDRIWISRSRFRDLHLARLVHELQRQLLDLRFERRREQQRLPRLRQAAKDALHRRQEAHVEHAIGFVEHQHFDRVELGGAALHVVEQSAGARDQHVYAATQLFDLRLHAGATVDGGDVQAQVLAIGAQAFGDLHGKLARRREDQRARLARAVAGGRAFGQALQQRQAERGGLAGAGLGAAEHVVAGENERNGLGLDRRRRGVAVFGQRAQQRGREPERFERHGCSSVVVATGMPAADSKLSLGPRCECWVCGSEGVRPCLRDERRTGRGQPKLVPRWPARRPEGGGLNLGKRISRAQSSAHCT
jgi:hypothetical protein